MNVEMFFVKTFDRDELGGLLRRRLQAPPDESGAQPDWGLPSSYDVLLSREPKRKIAISPVKDDWIAGIESKEVLDFALLQRISVCLKADVIGVQLSEVTGCCGYALCSNGQLIEHYFSEEEDDPYDRLCMYLREHAIRHSIITFREAVGLLHQGWEIVN